MIALAKPPQTVAVMRIYTNEKKSQTGEEQEPTQKNLLTISQQEKTQAMHVASSHQEKIRKTTSHRDRTKSGDRGSNDHVRKRRLLHFCSLFGEDRTHYLVTRQLGIRTCRPPNKNLAADTSEGSMEQHQESHSGFRRASGKSADTQVAWQAFPFHRYSDISISRV